jgi:hypothetical protein
MLRFLYITKIYVGQPFNIAISNEVPGRSSWDEVRTASEQIRSWGP